MKITKAMGRACLDELMDGRERQAATAAISELKGESWGLSDNELYLALAMCAAIAGVSPESVESK